MSIPTSSRERKGEEMGRVERAKGKGKRNQRRCGESKKEECEDEGCGWKGKEKKGSVFC